MNRPVCLQKVRLKKHLKEVPGQTLHGVVDGQDVDPFAVLDVWACVDAGGEQTDKNKRVLIDSVFFNKNALCDFPT